jgi:SAM-dependent methyltransferase
MPGGSPQRSRHVNHRPDAMHCPGLFTVGDYMFDATLNGVLDSADTVTDLILSDVVSRRRVLKRGRASATDVAGDNDLTRTVFDGSLLADLLSTAYGLRRGAKILSVGTGAGAMTAALRALGYDAVGLDCEPERTADGSLVGDLIDLPFRDGHFDVVIERGLCLLPRNRASAAVKELRRVARRGVILGSITTDLTIDVLEHYDLVAGVATLASRWDWSDLMFANGFDHALVDPARLARAWKRVEEARANRWYEDASALSYCIYQVADTGAERHEAAVVPLPRIDVGHKDDRAPAFATSAALAS